MTWKEVTTSDLFREANQEERAEYKRQFFQKYGVPTLREQGLDDDELNIAADAFFSAPDDTGEGLLRSAVGSAARGFLDPIPSTLEVAGAFTGIESLEEAGQAVRGGIESMTPVNPAQEGFVTDAASILGQGAQIIATGGLGAATGLKFAGKAASEAARLQAAKFGAQAAQQAAMGSSAVSGGLERADQLGLEGGDRLLRGAIAGGTEFATEKLGGFASELGPIKKFLGDTPVGSIEGDWFGIPKSIAVPVSRGIVTEAGEEGLAEVTGQATDIAMAPEAAPEMDVKQVAYAMLLGGVGGAMFGGVEAAITPRTKRAFDGTTDFVPSTTPPPGMTVIEADKAGLLVVDGGGAIIGYRKPPAQVTTETIEAELPVKLVTPETTAIIDNVVATPEASATAAALARTAVELGTESGITDMGEVDETANLLTGIPLQRPLGGELAVDETMLEGQPIEDEPLQETPLQQEQGSVEELPLPRELPVLPEQQAAPQQEAAVGVVAADEALKQKEPISVAEDAVVAEGGGVSKRTKDLISLAEAPLPKGAGARKATKEGQARVDAAKQRLRDIINNDDIVGRQRADMIEDGNMLIAYLQATAGRDIETDYSGGDQIALTYEDAEDGFETFIYLEGSKAGKSGVRMKKETLADLQSKKQQADKDFQAGIRRVRESGKSDQLPKATPTQVSAEPTADVPTESLKTELPKVSPATTGVVPTASLPATGQPTLGSVGVGAVKPVSYEQIQGRIQELLRAPTASTKKPAVSFKTQTEEKAFALGFENATKRQGEPLPEMMSNRSAKDQRWDDAWAKGWSSGQVFVRSLPEVEATPSNAPPTPQETKAPPPPSTTQPATKEPTEPQPAAEATGDAVVTPQARDALASARLRSYIATLPAKAQAAWSQERLAAADSYYATGDTKALEPLTKTQQSIVKREAVSGDASAAFEAQQKEAFQRRNAPSATTAEFVGDANALIDSLNEQTLQKERENREDGPEKKPRFSKEYVNGVIPTIRNMLNFKGESRDIINKAAGKKLTEDQQVDVVVEWVQILKEEGNLVLPSDFAALTEEQYYLLEPALKNLGIIESAKRPSLTRATDGAVVSTGVNPTSARAARNSYIGVIPGAEQSWLGTVAEFEAEFGDTVNFGGGLTKPGKAYEALVTDDGRVFIFTDNVQILEGDKARSETYGTTPGVEAVKRLMRHESFGHRGFMALPAPLKQRFVDLIDAGVIPEADLDSLVNDRDYAHLKDWRTVPATRQLAAEEWLAQRMERMQRIPKSGPMQPLLDWLRDVWRWLTGSVAGYSGETDDLVQLRDIMREMHRALGGLEQGQRIVTVGDVRASVTQSPQAARHAALEAKFNAGTITAEETAEAEAIVAEVARGAGYESLFFHGTDKPWNVANINRKPTTIGSLMTQIATGKVPVFASSSPTVAGGYGSNVMPLLIKTQGAATVDGGGKRWGYSQAELDKALKANSVVIVKNTNDNIGDDIQELSDVVAVADPNSIKSAAPFTGVPLDQRFDSTSNDIRASIRQAPETPRFKELTRDLPAKPTAADIAKFQETHPDEYQELVKMRADVLKRGGWDVKAYHGTPTGGFTEFSPEYQGRTGGRARGGFSFTTNLKAAESYAKSFSDESVALDEAIRVANASLIPHRKNNALVEYFSEIGYDGLPEFYWGAIDSNSEFADSLRYFADGIESIQPDVASAFRQSATILESGDTVKPEIKSVFLRLGEAPLAFDATPSTLGEVVAGLDVRDTPSKSAVVSMPDGEKVFYVADPNQIKSADPLATDDAGNLITPDQWADETSPNIRASRTSPIRNYPNLSSDETEVTAKDSLRRAVSEIMTDPEGVEKHIPLEYYKIKDFAGKMEAWTNKVIAPYGDSIMGLVELLRILQNDETLFSELKLGIRSGALLMPSLINEAADRARKLGSNDLANAFLQQAAEFGNAAGTALYASKDAKERFTTNYWLVAMMDLERKSQEAAVDPKITKKTIGNVNNMVPEAGDEAAGVVGDAINEEEMIAVRVLELGVAAQTSPKMRGLLEELVQLTIDYGRLAEMDMEADRPSISARSALPKTKEERVALMEKIAKRQTEILKEIDAENKKAKASPAAKQPKPVETAKQIINKITSTAAKEPAKKKTPDAVRELYRKQLKTPMSDIEFTRAAKEAGLSGDTIKQLKDAIDLEIAAIAIEAKKRADKRTSEKELKEAEDEESANQKKADAKINEVAERLSDPSLTQDKAKKVDEFRKLYEQQVKEPLPVNGFIDAMVALEVDEDTAEQLFDIAALDKASRDAIKGAKQDAKYQTDALAKIKEVVDRLADPAVTQNKERKVNKLRDLYENQVKTPESYDDFRAKAAFLSLDMDVTRQLFDAAALDADSRQRVRDARADIKAREISEAQASRLIYSQEETLRQGSKDREQSADGDSINKAFREQVAKPMPMDAFVERLGKLKVTKATAERMYRTAERVAVDNEAAILYKQRSKFLDVDTAALANFVNELRRGGKLTGKKIKWADLLSLPVAHQETIKAQLLERVKKHNVLRDLSASEQVALAEALEKIWQRERRKIFKRMIKRADMAGVSKETQDVIAEAAPAMLRYINQGMLGSSAFYRAVGEKFGIEPFSPESIAKIEKLAAQMQEPGITSLERGQLASKLTKEIQSQTVLPMPEVLSSYWVTSVLTGTATQMDMALNVSTGMLSIAKKVVASIIKTRSTKDARAGLSAFGSGLIDAAQIAWPNLWDKDLNLLPQDADSAMAFLADGGSNAGLGTGEKMMLRKGNKPQDKIYRGLGSILAFYNRLFSGLDFIVSSATAAGTFQMAAALNPRLYDAALIPSKEDKINAFKQAQIRFPNAPRSQQLALSQSMIDDGIHLLGKNLDEATMQKFKQMRQDVKMEGRTASYQEDPTGMGGVIYESIKKSTAWWTEVVDEARKKARKRVEDKKAVLGDDRNWNITAQMSIKVLDALYLLSSQSQNALGFRFMRFAGNKFNELISYIPALGLLRLEEEGMFRDGERTLRGQNILHNQAIGLMAGTLFLWAMNALNEDDEERGWIVNGSWKNLTPERKKQQIDAGFKENSISFLQPDGTWRSYNYISWPLAGWLASFGAISDYKRLTPEKWDEKSLPSKIAAGMYAGISSISDISSLSNLTEMFGRSSNTTDPAKNFSETLIRAGSSYVGGFVPKVIKDMETWIDGNYYKPEEPSDFLVKELPFFRRSVGAPLRDIFAEPIQIVRTPWRRIVQQSKDDPAYKNLAKLNARGLWLTPPNPKNRKVRRGGATRDLTSQEADAYVTEVGKAYKRLMESRAETFLKMPVERAEQLIEKATTRIREIALRKALSGAKSVATVDE